jgi:hypothetical protein
MKRILIASCSYDRDAIRSVVDKLKGRGYDCLIYEADQVTNGTVDFSLAIRNDSSVMLTYGDVSCRPEEFAAAWHRRPGQVGLESPDKGKQLSLSYEIHSLNGGLWRLVDDSRWLNSPATMKAVDNKLQHLALARQLGFTIPDTIVTNSWNTVKDTLPEDIIMKMPRGLLYINNEMRSAFTTALHNTMADLPTQTTPFPGIFQPRIGKTREWRITVVGDQTFDAAIYSDESTGRLDWRMHQFTPAVRFVAESFPEEYRTRCVEFLRRLGLRYGAFDFIENEAGITFLECNLNGQYMWLEEDLGLPISAAIVDELVSIAEKH